ncbi:FAD/NAD(P)-binding protein [Corynebacterium sp. zg-331]|uniref:FAD/NAD(P)-binding protein n=1 Tax=unclassified Corynebacterium TaxID=2624378 RepID=UPI00128D135C|nr:MULTISPECIES: FAD/NAD(P)-binding protein [unclassified Corynebacterium]MBC3185029.1 FAD/NAD(P)-binding protein [Corynebacterium sp. zg-331]MPV51529.1 exopolyphosphatase [Corynebacterium sp. zg331]
MTTPAIAVIGMGPRGVSVVERIAAARPASPLTLHLIDDAPLGSGRVWDPEQTRTLCMNTLAAKVTLFTEPGSSVGAPVTEGPTLYEWIRLLRGEADVPEAAARAWWEHPADATTRDAFLAEARATEAWSHPSRALYGAYLRWCYELALRRLPPAVTVREHRHRAVGLRRAESSGLDLIDLADGTRLPAHATVLTLGWQVPARTPEEKRLHRAATAHDLLWVRPDNPVEQNLDAIRPGEQVLARGLGMGFFDVMALLTLGRGGRFEEAPTRSGLRYLPSGREPRIAVGSRRGYPFLPKSDYRALPPTPRLRHLKEAIARLSPGTAPIDFREVWPDIVRDARDADPAFDPAAWLHPLSGMTGTPEQVTERIAGRLGEDIRAAAAGERDATKAALWEISAARKPVSLLGAQGRYTPESLPALRGFMALGQMVGSGPPLFRSRQLLALIDAGLVTMMGAGARVEADERFTLRAATSTESRSGRVLVDAWMHAFDVRASADPLARCLDGRWRSFAGSGSPETDATTRVLINPDGAPDPRVHLIGIPTHAQMPDTTISPIPGSDPLMLQETDRAARHALAVALGS